MLKNGLPRTFLPLCMECRRDLAKRKPGASILGGMAQLAPMEKLGGTRQLTELSNREIGNSVQIVGNALAYTVTQPLWVDAGNVAYPRVPLQLKSKYGTLALSFVTH